MEDNSNSEELKQAFPVREAENKLQKQKRNEKAKKELEKAKAQRQENAKTDDLIVRLQGDW